MKQVVVSKRFVKMDFLSLGPRVTISKALDLFRVFCYPKLTGRKSFAQISSFPHFCHFTANIHHHTK